MTLNSMDSSCSHTVSLLRSKRVTNDHEIGWQYLLYSIVEILAQRPL